MVSKVTGDNTNSNFVLTRKILIKKNLRNTKFIFWPLSRRKIGKNYI